MAVRESSPAQRAAVRKHDTEKVDKINIRFPKGTKERIYNLGYTVNAYVIDAVIEKLDREEGNTVRVKEPESNGPDGIDRDDNG